MAQTILHSPSSQPNQPPFPLTLAAAAGGSDQFPACPNCGGFHSDSYDCRPPWLSDHLDSRDPGIPNR